jgi:hypothetical protein
MSGSVIAAIGISALAVFFFLIERDSLVESHARPRTQALNAGRWASVVVLSWLLNPLAFSQPKTERVATILGLVILIGAVMLIPMRWFVRLGGRERAWELRRAKVEVAHLANKVRRDRASITVARLQETIDRIRTLQYPGTTELCDLMVAELEDLAAGAESWNEAGRRSIRIDELSRSLWPRDMPLPEHDVEEATSRWHLYRTFGKMMELAAVDSSRSSRYEFRKLLASLAEWRAPETYRFIDAVEQSAYRWLAADPSSTLPWITSFSFEALGPDGLAEVRRIWGRDSSLWGAQLDGNDLRAIEQDLARRAASTQAASEPPVVPAAEAG